MCSTRHPHRPRAGEFGFRILRIGLFAAALATPAVADPVQVGGPEPTRLVVHRHGGPGALAALSAYGFHLTGQIPALNLYRIEGPPGLGAAVVGDSLVILCGATWVEDDVRTVDPGPGPSNDDLSASSGTTASWLEVAQVPEAQQVTGSTPASGSVLVAVLDAGVDPAHPALFGRLATFGHDYILDVPGAVEFADGKDGDGDGQVDEAHGRGTHLLGTVALVHPGADLWPARVVDDEGCGWSFDAARALVDAVAAGSNLALLGSSYAGAPGALLAAVDHARANGVEVFVPAGDTGGQALAIALHPGADEDDDPPTCYAVADLSDGVVGVGALDLTGAPASFSAVGEGVDLFAPGVSVIAPIPGGDAATWSGTATAAAVATGAAALVLTGDTHLGAGPAAPRLLESAGLLDPLKACTAGRLDALAAVLLTAP